LDEIEGISYDTFEHQKPGEMLKLTAGTAYEIASESSPFPAGFPSSVVSLY
jgi:hypothetical protein